MVHLKLGYACNNACLVCPYGEKRLTEPQRDGAAALAALPDAAGAEGDALSLSGGEVLLRRDLPGLIRRARAKGYGRIQLQTNGRMLAYPSAARALREAGATDLLVLVLGPEAAIHDFHARAPGSFAQTALGLRNAVGAGIAVELRAILTKSSYRHAPDLVRLAAGAGARRLRLAFPCGIEPRRFRALVPRLGKLAEHVAAAAELGAGTGVPVATEGFPLCHAAAPLGPDEALWGKGDPPPEGWASHGPPCDRCAARARCPGLEAAYAAAYGFDELLPSAS